MHAAHGIADDEANMVQTETLGEQAILRVNHVGVIVFGEFRFQTIGRLQAFAVSDAVGDDDVIFGGVFRHLTRIKFKVAAHDLSSMATQTRVMEEFMYNEITITRRNTLLGATTLT